MDRLAPFFERFSLSARMFYSGLLCGVSPTLNEQAGYLHVLRKGTLTVTHPNARRLVLDTPSASYSFRVPTNTVFTAQKKKALNSSALRSNSAPEC